MKGKLNNNIIAVFIASFFSFHIYIAMALLASLYAAFPDVNPNLVILMYSAPSLFSAFLSLAIGTFITKVNKKALLLTGMGLIILCGVLIVFTNGSSFPVALAGVLSCGAGYAIIMTCGNTILMESSAPEDAPQMIAINSAVGCVGGIAIMALSGILAKNNWVNAYWLCFPVILSFIAVMLLYKTPVKSAEAAADISGSPAGGAAQAATRYLGLFMMVVVCFLFVNFCTASWNANYATYVMVDKGIGTTVETGLISTLASVGGALGGFFLAGPFIKSLKAWACPIAMLFVPATCLMGALGVSSIYVLYIGAVIFMMFYQVVYATMVTTAGGLYPGGSGVSFVQGALGIGGFLAPYIINAIAGPMGGTTSTKFMVGILFEIVALILAVPVLKKSREKLGG